MVNAGATAELMAGHTEGKQREHYVTIHPRSDRAHMLRVVEALLFASSEPVTCEALAASLPEGTDVQGLLEELQRHYAGRGVNVVQVAGKWTLRTAGDLSFLLRREGRPVTYGTTEAFLRHFGLNDLLDLPGLLELKGAGLLDANLPPDFDVPQPLSSDDLTEDEEPLEDASDEQAALEMDLPEEPPLEEDPETPTKR
jgi:hypothetical protein